MSLKFSPFCFFLLVFCIQFASSERFDDCGKRKYSKPLLAGGSFAALGQFPWHAALMVKEGNSTNYICGASIITRKHLLTAAHCIQQFKGASIRKPESIKVLVGGLDLSDSDQVHWSSLDVVNITLHHEWALELHRYDADLAILELESRLTFTQKIRRVCLPEPSQEVVGRNGTVVGYGLTEVGRFHSKIPKFIDLTTKHALKCVLAEYGFGKVVSERMFCAGEPGRTACIGDSGSSFVEVSELERFTVIGLVSSNIVGTQRTCDPNMPSAYTSTPAFVDWIKDVVKSELPDSVTKLDAIPSRCTEPLVIGSCEKHETKFYFDSTGTKECRQFTYSGCDGNGNSFDTLLECQSHCQSLQKYRRCQELATECSNLECKYGVTSSSDLVTGCSKCKCNAPCAGYSCPEGQRCFASPNFEGYPPKFVPECYQVSKPGSCPTTLTQNFPENLLVCNDDADCSGDNKCCQYVTLSLCLLPSSPLKIEEVPFEESNPSGKEDGSVTLRCRATGDPKPTISWTRHGAKVEPETGRFVLSSTGELQIFNLEMADSGTYVCTANSGVGGKVSKEFSLAVHQVIRGEKGNKELGHLDGEKRVLYTFETLEGTTIDTKTSEIASDRDDKVTAIRAWHMDTISYLPINVAEVFPNLLHYEIYDCPITEIKKKHFRSMTKLEDLSLYGNKISSIDKDVFEDLIALKWLYLNSNRLTSLHEDTFSNNRALQELFLGDNAFKSLPSKLLQNLSELKVFWFFGNKLKTLDASFFAHNLKLERIELHRNQIEHLSPSTFTGLVKLTFVDLKWNKCISKQYGKDDQGYAYESLSWLSSDLARLCSQSRG